MNPAGEASRFVESKDVGTGPGKEPTPVKGNRGKAKSQQPDSESEGA